MLEQGFLKSHFVGRDGFIWWIGQVAPKETWQNNFGDGKLKQNGSDIKGWGERYRVRIMGYHTADKGALPDNELPFATIMYPVTAGAGTGGASQSSNIVAGNFVFGFFMDGEDAQQPVIMGVVGYNEVQAVLNDVPAVAFKPFYGIDKKPSGGKLATANTKTLAQQTTLSNGAGGSVYGTNAQEYYKVDPVSQKLVNSKQAVNNHKSPDNKIANHIPSAGASELPVKGIQKELQKAIQSIEQLKRSIVEIGAEQTERIENLQEEINAKIDIASDAVASGIKWVYEMIEEHIFSKMNKAFEKIYFAAHPNERENVENVTSTVLDTLACVFRKIFRTMLGMVSDFIKETINKVVNVPTCFVEKFVGNTLGMVSGVLNGAMDGVKDAIGSVTDLAADGLDLAGDVMGIISNVISFLNCDDNSNNSPVDEWSHIDGSGQQFGKGSITNIISRAKEYGSKIQNVPANALDSFDFASNVNLSETMDPKAVLDGCVTDEFPCGPPELNVFGSQTGAGAAGNLVVNASGEVLGVDMQSFGLGYDSQTRTNVIDKCGKGSGAVIRPVFGDVNNNFKNKKRKRGANKGTPATAPESLGFNNFKEFEYEFNESSDDSVRTQPFSPENAAYGTPAYGLGPSFSKLGKRASKTQLKVRKDDLQVDFGIDIFTIPVAKTKEKPNVKFILRDKTNVEGVDTDFDFVPDDIAGKGRLINGQVITPTAESIAESNEDGGSVLSFELYESGSANNVVQGYNSKNLDEWAYSGYGGRANTWDSLSDSVRGEVDMVGGSGTGLRVLVKFAALDGKSGNPSNTKYKIISIIDSGINYQQGDILTFPDVKGKNISGASASGGGGISLKVTSTSFADSDGFRIVPKKMIIGTDNEKEDLKNFKQAFEGGQRIRVVKGRDYLVQGFQFNGDPLFNPLKVTNEGKCLLLDDVKGRKLIRESKEVEVVTNATRPITFKFSHKDASFSNAFSIPDLGIESVKAEGSNSKFEPSEVTVTVESDKEYKVIFKSGGSAALLKDVDNFKTIQCNDNTDDDYDDCTITISEGKFYNLRDGGTNGIPVREANCFFKFETTTSIETVWTERLTKGTSDDDFDDLVICTKKGRFRTPNNKKLRESGALIYRIGDSDTPDTDPPDTDTPTPTNIIEPVLEVPTSGQITIPSGGGGGGIPGILGEGPGNNSTFHPFPKTTTLGPGKWVPGPIPPGGGGPHAGPAIFIHNEELFGELLGKSGIPFAEALEGSFGPGGFVGGGGGPEPGGFGPGLPGPGGIGPGPGPGPGGVGPGPGPGPGGVGPGGPGPGPGGIEPGPGPGPGGVGPGGPGPALPIPGPGGIDPGGFPSPVISVPPGPGVFYPDETPSPSEPGIPGILVPPAYGGISGPGVGVIDVIVETGGGGYESSYPGAFGGDGRTYAPNTSTRVTYEDGTKEIPREPGNRMCVDAGDVVKLPNGTRAITEPFDGEGGGELIIGGTDHVMKKAGCFTTPLGGIPPKNENTYPILMYLCDVIVKKPGFNYKNTDTVVIDPSRGAEAELVVDKFGRISDVIITKSGEGFKEIPSITVDSQTGQDAVLLGKLCIDRVKDVTLVDQEKLIQVVDCVGKF